MNVARTFTLVFVAVAAFALAGEKLSPSKLLKDADKLDSKDVVVVGKVSDFQQKTSRIGNKYFVFKMKDGEESLSVYARGEAKPEIKDGVKVEANGIFRKEKKVSNFTVKNEVDASTVKDKPYGVKKVD